MNSSRISSVIDFAKMQAATVTVVGAGGSADLLVALTRCGVGDIQSHRPRSGHRCRTFPGRDTTPMKSAA